MRANPLRILHVIGAMNRGGAETLVMNLYRSIDRSRIQFDFLVNELGTCDYDKEIDELGGKMFEVPRYNIANYPRLSTSLPGVLFQPSSSRRARAHRASRTHLPLDRPQAWSGVHRPQPCAELPPLTR